jgi:protein phosphatase
MRQFRIVGRTETGPVRKANEDHILVGRFVKNRGQMAISLDADDEFILAHGLLLAVADGVGGQAGGAQASRLALSVLNREFYVPVNDTTSSHEALERIQIAASVANQAILIRSAEEPMLRSMAATLTGICLTQEGYLVFNAGDSRVYRLRGGYLKQLTEDDTVTAHAVRAGAMTRKEAHESPIRHTLTNALGSMDFTLEIKEGPELWPGDRILVCSDGLHDLISHEELEEILAGMDLDKTLDLLFQAAVDGGGHDNISAVILAAI